MIEIGQDVSKSLKEETYVYYEGIDSTHVHPEDLNITGVVIPEFWLPGAIGCPASWTDGVCGDVDFNDDAPLRYDMTTDDMEELALNLFEFTNRLRDSVFRQTFIDDITTNYYAGSAASCWSTPDEDPYIWSETLARAARHVLNDQGACGTYGDSFGNNLVQNL